MNTLRGSEWRKWDLHIHTASSYDSKYKGEDADELLCHTLVENNICAVAITDHFKIDADRIKHLRSLAPNIVFFPGVELRTDKGSNNLHLIIIFSETADLQILSEDFNAIMLRDKAKRTESDETIYWTYEDIINFAQKHDALISIHAGSKASGIDKEIPNALPIQEAIKEDIAENIHFFEVGKKKDIDSYYQHVFKVIEEKPIIMCSDCHDPRSYTVKENLWIKADLTFEGLKQCIFQPKERVYVGTIPPALDRACKGERVCIDNVTVTRVDSPKNTDKNWFKFNMPLNTGLVAVIGNKGSGKSAFSDIIGQLCKCTTMSHASFLNENRFRKLPKNYANDYSATITWKDGHTATAPLSYYTFDTTIEDAQYLPQKYIEDVCNDIDNIFQQEIDKVIFSYVDKTERGNALNLHELVASKARTINSEIERIKHELITINEQLIKLEHKKTSQYHTYVTDSYRKITEDLQRHDNTKPKEIQKPEPKDGDQAYQQALKVVNEKIASIESLIQQNKERLSYLNIALEDSQHLLTTISQLENNCQETQKLLDTFIQKYEVNFTDKQIKLITPRASISAWINELHKEKQDIFIALNGTESSEGLLKSLEKVKEEKDELIASANIEEKQYQKYLQDLSDWETIRKEIIGDTTTDGTLSFFEAENKYIEEQLDAVYESKRSERNQLLQNIFENKKKLVEIYNEIYTPVANEIKRLLGNLEDGIDFIAEIQLVDSAFTENTLAHINQKYAGVFKGKAESQIKMEKLVKNTEFHNKDSILQLVNDVLTVVYEDFDSSEKKVINKLDFYNFLFGLDYIGVSFKLKMGGRDLEELSPGERGIVLLIFYLALSKNNTPIIIDQPEDNLDNQSVYSKLVPCICAAKHKRQVIIVTHNPNIAIACDAEQIICCHMDKNNSIMTYESGAIENPNIKKNVIDILEGTMPAFDLRKKKYFTT